MLEILSQIVLHIIHKLSDAVVTFGSNHLSTRRTLLSGLIRLYDALATIEEASRDLHAEFCTYADGSEVITKLISGKKLDTLNTAYKKYIAELEAVGRILEIYDMNLHINLVGAGTFKGNFWKQIDFSDQPVPEMVKENDKKTFRVSFPTALPNELGSEISFPRFNQRDLEERAPLVRQEIIQKFNRTPIDLRNSEELKGALAAGEECINRMARSRQLLATLIRERFPMDSLFK